MDAVAPTDRFAAGGLRLNRYLESGLAGLRPRKARGAEARIPPEAAGVIRRWVIEGPVKRGLDRANWT